MTADDHARGFPAFGPVKRRPGAFARSWWGTEWIRAMEDVALNSASLAKGRRYARGGHVGSITVSPGLLSATVFDDAGLQHHTRVRVEQLSDARWDRFLDQVAATAGHIAALLDRDMPQDLVSAAGDAGVRLLPDFGDLEQECTCPDWGHPCRHAAALSYQASWLLDEDPFLLLLLRGRGERELTGELQRRNVAAARPAETVAPQGTDANTAYAAAVGPLPPEPAVPDPAPPQPEFPPAPGVAPAALALLVADAAARARALLLAPRRPLDTHADAVRLAATYPELADRLGTSAEFRRDVAAWRHGGAGFVEVLAGPWSPPANSVARARTALETAWEGERTPEFDVWRNRWTVRGRELQLRYGRDGNWYPLRRDGQWWWPAGAPARDLAAAVNTLLSPDD